MQVDTSVQFSPTPAFRDALNAMVQSEQPRLSHSDETILACVIRHLPATKMRRKRFVFDLPDYANEVGGAFRRKVATLLSARTPANRSTLKEGGAK